MDQSPSYPIAANEEQRLEALRALAILGTHREAAFDAVVSLARDALKAPIALVSFLDEKEQWFKAADGVDLEGTDRRFAFCNYAVASGKPFVVQDASNDLRFQTNPLVTNDPRIRFYAGVPLSIEPGVHLGTVCVLDTAPRQLLDSELEHLGRLAEIVNALIRQYRDARASAQLSHQLRRQNAVISEQSKSLVRSKRIFDDAAALTKTGAWEWNRGSDELIWTDGMYDIHEMARGSQVTWTQIQQAWPLEFRQELKQQFLSVQPKCGGLTFEGPIETATGKQKWVRITADVEHENGRVVRRYGVKQDITEQRALWNRLQFLAERDSLTELPNRKAFYDELRRRTVRDRGNRSSNVLLLLDVDGFKHVNDTFGHAAGDRCIRQLGKRLTRVCGAHFVARLGGDEFAVVIAEESDEALMVVVDQTLSEMRRPVRWRGQTFCLSCAIGIARFEQDGISALTARADLALYAAKALGGNTHQLFDPDMKARAERRYRSVRDINEALSKNELTLYYQPKLDLSTHKLSGFEALLRWKRADGQVIPAGSFLEALSDADLSSRLDEFVIKTALDQAEQWKVIGFEFGHIAINLSARQFQDPNLAGDILEKMSRRGLSSSEVEVEVTEGVLLNQRHEVVLRTLETFKSAGIRIALDDFGTGYASLTHLRTFPVDTIKIDRSFVKDFLVDRQDNAILQSVLFLARQMQLDVVAEGIEEAEQCEFLKALGCRYGQGYLFSKAIPAKEAMTFAYERKRKAA